MHYQPYLAPRLKLSLQICKICQYSLESVRSFSRSNTLHNLNWFWLHIRSTVGDLENLTINQQVIRFLIGSRNWQISNVCKTFRCELFNGAGWELIKTRFTQMIVVWDRSLDGNSSVSNPRWELVSSLIFIAKLGTWNCDDNMQIAINLSLGNWILSKLR